MALNTSLAYASACPHYRSAITVEPLLYTTCQSIASIIGSCTGVGNRNMQVIFHIGFHKTGSSAIQEHLFSSRESLLASNVLYPDPLCPFPSHGELAWCFLGNDAPWKDKEYNPSEVVAHYQDLIDNTACDKVVLSSEDLSLLPHIGNSFRIFANSFAKYDVRIVAYIRNPFHYLISSYHHAIKEGHTDRSFQEFLAFSFFDRAIDYESRLGRWADAFGQDAIVLREYRPDRAVEDFHELLGLAPPSPCVETKKVNAGVHAWISESYRKLPQNADGNRARELLLEASTVFPRINDLHFYLGDNWEYIMRERVGLDYHALWQRYSRKSIA